MRQWCNSRRKLWVYPVDGSAPFCASPRKFAAEKKLYTPKNGAAAVRADTESWFSGWESHFAKVWPAIVDRADNPETRANVARFIATLVARHPIGRNGIGKLNAYFLRMSEGLSSDEQLTYRGREGEMQIKVSEIRQFARTDAESVRTDFIRIMPALSRTLANALISRRWGVVFSENQDFVTSDNPVVLNRAASRERTYGFDTPGTMVNFPVSPWRFIVIADEWELPFCHYKLDDVRVFVRRVVNAARRFVFSASENRFVAEAIQDRKNIKQER